MTIRCRSLLALLLALCLMAAPAAPRARAADSGKAEEITRKCSFRVSEGNKEKFTDLKLGTAWTYSHTGAWIGVRIPSAQRAGALRVEWLFEPSGYQVIEYDDAMNPLRQRDERDSFPCIYTVFELLPETKYIELKMTAMDQSVCAVRVYSEGALPSSVQIWEPPVEKADLMVVSTHQDDELIYLGGTIPYYAVARQAPTVVVYMANCKRSRRGEALDALWVMGVRNYPVFTNLEDDKVGSINQGLKLWGGKDNILRLLAGHIRRFKPEVIVTQDLNGEYGHNQHKIVAAAMMYAIEAAADETRYADSFETYGAWQVKKLYHHLYAKNEIKMDWLTKLPELRGYSPLDVAKIGMEKHASQTEYFHVKSGGKYDNAKFGLYFTAVGADVKKNDFLENIDPDASANYLAAQAEEAAAAAAQAAEADAAPEGGTDAVGGDESLPALDGVGDGIPEGTGADDAATADADADADGAQSAPPATREASGRGWAVAGLGAAAIAAGAGAWALVRRSRRRRGAHAAKRAKASQKAATAGARRASQRSSVSGAGRVPAGSGGAHARHAAKR